MSAFSYTDRIIVAAGGSGGVCQSEGAPGGCLYGYRATSNDAFAIDYSISQTSGVEDGTGENGDKSMDFPGSGAGGGWRGGKKTTDASTREKSYQAVASSGSSYISGYNGCTKKTIFFTNGVMKPGYRSGSGMLKITINFNCSKNCIACSSSTVCTKCKANFLLHNNSCVSSCPSGYVKSDTSCVKCKSPCKTCSSSRVTCNSCVDGYFLYDNKCQKGCPDGYYEYNSTKKCLKCSTFCTLCKSSYNNCFACAENYTLNNNRCVKKCPDEGMVQVGSTCQPCFSSCKTCFPTQSDCTSCKEGFYLYENKCVVECPNKFYGEDGVCKSCQEPCETCNSKEKCITCSAGFHLSDGNCVAEETP